MTDCHDYEITWLTRSTVSDSYEKLTCWQGWQLVTVNDGGDSMSSYLTDKVNRQWQILLTNCHQNMMTSQNWQKMTESDRFCLKEYINWHNQITKKTDRFLDRDSHIERKSSKNTTKIQRTSKNINENKVRKSTIPTQNMTRFWRDLDWELTRVALRKDMFF